MKLPIQLRTLLLLSSVLITTLGIIIILALQLIPLVRQIALDISTVSSIQSIAPRANNANHPAPTALSQNPTAIAGAMLMEVVSPTPALSATEMSVAIEPLSNPPASLLIEGNDSSSRTQGRVTGALVNIRSAPSIAGEVLAQLSANQEIEIVETSADGAWFKICCPLGTSVTREAWVSSELVQAVAEAAVPAITMRSALSNPGTGEGSDTASAALVGEQSKLQGTVNGAFVNLRNGPGTNYPIVGQIAEATAVTVVGRNEQNNWLLLCCLHSTFSEGWISAEFVDLPSGTDRDATIVKLPLIATPPASITSQSTSPANN